MFISHTRDNKIVLGSEIVKLQDVLTVIPSYSIIEDCDHYIYDEGVLFLFKTNGDEVKQYAAVSDHSSILNQLESNSSSIIAARDMRIEAENQEEG